jgi:uncharacterized protein DUF5677
MKQRDFWNSIEDVIGQYSIVAQTEMVSRWSQWPRTVAEREKFEVIGALAARQTTLSIQLAYSPYFWNADGGSLVLRAMADIRINLAWILMDPMDRARKFIAYGLGQEKLHIENQKERLRSEGADPNDNEEMKAWEEWLNSQRYTFLTEVSIGSWSGLDTRKMAEEANLLDFYRDYYAPLSGPTHSMWQHLVKFNLVMCRNPLHGFHRLPVAPTPPYDIDYPLQAAHFLDETWQCIDKHFPISKKPVSAYDQLLSRLDELGSSLGPCETSEHGVASC